MLLVVSSVLIQVSSMIVRTFRRAIKSMKGEVGSDSNERTAQDLSMKFILIAILVLTLLVWLVPAIPVTLVGAIIVVIFSSSLQRYLPW